jgi:mannose-6-phosphate isomerase-like protein (cupin superfamily)
MATIESSFKIVGFTLAVALLLTLIPDGPACQAAETEAVLTAFAEDYVDTRADTVALVVQFEFSPEGAWYVVSAPGERAELHRGSHPDAAVTIKMSTGTLQEIYKGRMTAFTAGAKGSGADTAPLEMDINEPAGRLSNPKNVILGFLQHFFILGSPERIILREESSRVVHGAHVIPLYYAEGFRSAWYKVKPGQHLNEPGDTNPYPQAFIIISGRGRAKIGESEVEVEAGASYYIPPDSDHVLWTEGDQELVLIWLAWGEGA